MQEGAKIQLDDSRHRDYQTLSPSKRPSVVKSDEAGDVEAVPEAGPAVKVRTPRRILHFSDGILEEYSTDEDEAEAVKKATSEAQVGKALIDPKTLTWVPWMVHYTWFAGSTLFRYCDAWGEKLAWFLGITSPKYYYELEEYKRMQEEEKERQSKLDTEMHGWAESPAPDEIVGTDPTKTHETS